MRSGGEHSYGVQEEGLADNQMSWEAGAVGAVAEIAQDVSGGDLCRASM